MPRPRSRGAPSSRRAATLEALGPPARSSAAPGWAGSRCTQPEVPLDLTKPRRRLAVVGDDPLARPPMRAVAGQRERLGRHPGRADSVQRGTWSGIRAGVRAASRRLAAPRRRAVRAGSGTRASARRGPPRRRAWSRWRWVGGATRIALRPASTACERADRVSRSTRSTRRSGARSWLAGRTACWAARALVPPSRRSGTARVAGVREDERRAGRVRQPARATASPRSRVAQAARNRCRP